MGRLHELSRAQLRAGAQLDYQLSLFGVPVRWRTHITDWQPGKRFVDEQESGPYALRRHTHEFEARRTSTLVRDIVDYSESLGPVGTAAHLLFVRRTFDRSRAGQPAEGKETNHAHVAYQERQGPKNVPGQAVADFDIEVF